MRSDLLPKVACWKHRGLRTGCEVAYFIPEPDRLNIEGTTVGLQDGIAWTVSYQIELDDAWRTRAARIETRTSSGSIDRKLETDGAGRWLVDGEPADPLNGCLDVDLEASAMTNTLPVHRLGLRTGQHAAVPAAYVRLPAPTSSASSNFIPALMIKRTAIHVTNTMRPHSISIACSPTTMLASSWTIRGSPYESGRRHCRSALA